jgi:microcystin degradation protein MlrC
MKDIMDRAMQAERDGEVCNASVFGGFPLSDIPCAGFSVVIVTERDRLAQGQQLLDELCTLAWRAARTLSFPPRQWPNRLPRPSACRRAR